MESLGLGPASALALPGRLAAAPGGRLRRRRVAAAAGGKLHVVAAENFWGSIAAQLGGDRVDVTSIITNPDTDPHDYEPTADDARAIAERAARRS